MTRHEAIIAIYKAIYKVNDSEIIDMTLEEELKEIANCIEEDSFESDED